MIVPIRICRLYKCLTLEEPGTRSGAWLVSLLHSCRGIWLRTTLRGECTEVGSWHLTVSSSKRLRWMRNISVFVRTLHYEHHILHQVFLPLAACAVWTWRQSTRLWQAVVLWHRRTTLIVTMRSYPTSTGTFVGIFGFQ